MKHPDPKTHLQLSLLKSFLRLLGYGWLLSDIPIAVVLLVASELVGILEELV